MMVETMGRCDKPKESIENLLHVKKIHFPEQPIDWGYLLDKFARYYDFYMSAMLFQQYMQFLHMCGMSLRVQALPFKVWCDFITHMIQTAAFRYNRDNSAILHRIQNQFTHFEDELHKLKEITSILELALWKKRINDDNFKENTIQCLKKIKCDDSSMRRHFRVSCGADVVIRHVLQYLISVDD
jgi:hypothetical protein